jgi:undecaprenyl-phosphate 4-deoxy-4-formamido-L-arabinose transferase
LLELEKQIDEALKTISYEIIFVNDNSKDNSWGIIKQLVNSNKRISAINFRKNFGQDSALLAGLKFAKGDYVVIMDDDLQHSPHDILKLYEECKKGFDICYADFREKKQAAWKNVGSWINGEIATILLDKPKGVYMSPFKIVRGAVVRDISFKGPYPYIDGILLELTNNVTSLRIAHHKRYKGKSNYSLIASISVFLKSFTSFSVVPLRIASIGGFFVASLGFLLGIYYLVVYFTTQELVEGWTSLIITNLIIGGLLMMTIGLIGEYIGRLYLTANNKPQYSIAEVIGDSVENGNSSGNSV